MVEIILALGCGAFVGFLVGNALADNPHKTVNERLSDEVTFLRGVVDRRDDHQKRIDRVKHGLTEVTRSTEDVDDPPPYSFLSLLDLFPNSASSTMKWAKKLRQQQVPWEKIEELYRSQIENVKPGFFEAKARRDAKKKVGEGEKVSNES